MQSLLAEYGPCIFKFMETLEEQTLMELYELVFKLRMTKKCKADEEENDKQVTGKTEGFFFEPITKKSDEVYFSFGRHLEELHVTWSHLEKKQTRLQTYTNIDQEFLYSGWRRRHKYNMTPSP
ncbi:hypothetical protein Tco_0884234 [Tanacetum coccineum]